MLPLTYHWYEYEVGELVQVPSSITVSVDPEYAVVGDGGGPPVTATTGGELFTGVGHGAVIM